MMEKWVIEAKKADFQRLAEIFQMDPVIIRLMVNRGISNEEKIRQYLYGNLTDLHNPHLMKDMDKGVAAILAAIEKGQKIVVASDFDVDGIFAGMVLLTGLERLGADARIKTPHRTLEGYGLNLRIVEEAYQEGAGLLITCDNGIAAFEALERAWELGLPVVVTDHHEVAYESLEDGTRRYLLPKADAIINPKQPDCPYPFHELCGAAVAFKLVQILYEEKGISLEELDPLLEYTAIATVADVMDLMEENRILVKEGLKRLARTRNIGLQALMQVNQLDPKNISAYHIGFILGPCFNAAGRLETVEQAFQLLRCTNAKEAYRLAVALKELNDSRKGMTRKGVEHAIWQIEGADWKQDPILVVALEDCHESLAGIIAGRLRERYYRPVIVLTAVEDGYKGSGRSIEAYHMFEGLQACRPLLTRFGGHAMAAGLSLSRENLPLLRERLNRDAHLTEADLTPVVRIDVPMPLQYIREDLILQLEYLEPFGKGNRKPLFAEKDFRIRKAAIIGKNQNVLKMRIANSAGTLMDALYFGDVQEFGESAIREYGEEMWQRAFSGEDNGMQASFAYYPSINEYKGNKTLQVIIQNYRIQEAL